jgi:hypothetical protein
MRDGWLVVAALVAGAVVVGSAVAELVWTGDGNLAAVPAVLPGVLVAVVSSRRGTTGCRGRRGA